MDVSEEQLYRQVTDEVAASPHIAVALNGQLCYIAINEVACSYLNVTAGQLIGKSALDLYPEITASKNHRNILKAFSGQALSNELIESRMGDMLITSYRPVFQNGTVKAIVIIGKLSPAS